VMKLFIGILACLVFFGCSPEKRLSKLLKAHPELAKTTVVKEVHRDTLISRETHKDSVITNIYSKDTVFIHDGRETVKYVYEGGTKAYISGTVKADTIIKIDTVKSKVTTVIQQVKAPKTAWENFCDVAVILCLIILVGKYIGIPIAKSLWPKLPL
ncbi:MAG: hypothetical protein ACHP6H_05195, partial [Legionellales bacterium]